MNEIVNNQTTLAADNVTDDREMIRKFLSRNSLLLVAESRRRLVVTASYKPPNVSFLIPQQCRQFFKMGCNSSKIEISKCKYK